MLPTFTKIYDSKQNDDGHFTRFVGLDCAAIWMILSLCTKKIISLFQFSTFCEEFHENISENVNVLVSTRERRIEIWIKVKIN